MSLLASFFGRVSKGAGPKNSAGAARDRLQILLAHERAGRDGPDFLPQLQQELIETIRKYVAVDAEKVQVRLDREQNLSVLELNIELPVGGRPSR